MKSRPAAAAIMDLIQPDGYVYDPERATPPTAAKLPSGRRRWDGKVEIHRVHGDVAFLKYAQNRLGTGMQDKGVQLLCEYNDDFRFSAAYDFAIVVTATTLGGGAANVLSHYVLKLIHHWQQRYKAKQGHKKKLAIRCIYRKRQHDFHLPRDACKAVAFFRELGQLARQRWQSAANRKTGHLAKK